MKSTQINGVRVYDLAQGKTLPLFMSGRERRALNKDPEFAKRVELLQDFAFKAYSRTVTVSRDGRYVLATGGYKPQIKMFDVAEVSLKFERHVDADVVAAEILSDDYAKLCLLGEDRTLSFHAKFGLHHTLRLPTFGRAMTFDRETSDLYVASASKSVYRVNLMEGRFRASWETSQTGDEVKGNNAIQWNPSHRLVAVAGQDGMVRLWDSRAKLEASALTVSEDALTALSFDQWENSGLTLVTGDEKGMCRVFDLRSAHPLLIKEHPYCVAIRSIAFKNGGNEDGSKRTVVTSDEKQIKGWNLSDGRALFNIECPFKIASVCVAPVTKLEGQSSGLIFATGDNERVGTFFVPSLGPAPRWASFLESLTEELEEKESQVYDDYRFVTKTELEDLNLGQLIGSPQLRPWMHGYFVDAKEFERLKAAKQPTAFEEYRRAKAKEKIEKKKSDRIVLREKVKINPELAERSNQLAEDDRFQSLFQDPAFTIDETSLEYKQMFPNGRRAATQRIVDDEEEEDEEEEDDEEEEEDKYEHVDVSKPAAKASARAVEAAKKVQTPAIQAAMVRTRVEIIKPTKSTKLAKSKTRSFLDDDDDGDKNGEQDEVVPQVMETMDKRLRLVKEKVADEESEKMKTTSNPDGSLSLTFIPKAIKPKGSSRGGDGAPRDESRGEGEAPRRGRGGAPRGERGGPPRGERGEGSRGGRGGSRGGRGGSRGGSRGGRGGRGVGKRF